jgi:hypothetical protein
MSTDRLELTLVKHPYETIPHNWRDLLRDELESRGFRSATAYADTQPHKPVCELTTELGADIAPTCLEQMLIEEAEASGTMERCARDLLARDLRLVFSDGWAIDGPDDFYFKSERASIFLGLSMVLPKAYRLAVARVRDAMDRATVPRGWLPEGPNDPVLLELFIGHWNPNSPSSAAPIPAVRETNARDSLLTLLSLHRRSP